MVFLVKRDACHLGRAKCTLDEQLHIVAIVDYVDILVAKLMHNTMHTASLYTYAGSNGVDAVIIAFHCHLGTVSRHTGNTAYGNQSVGNLRHFSFKQSFQKHRSSTAKNDAWVVVLIVNTQDHSLHCLALTVVVTGNLLAFGQMEFVALVIHEQHLALPHLINLGAHHLAYTVLILVIKRVVLQFEYLRGQCLSQIKDCAATELAEVHLFTHLLANFIVRLYLLGILE